MSEPRDIDARRTELAALRARIRELEAEIAASPAPAASQWPPRSFYHAYYLSTGAALGALAAAVSLLANVIGAPLAGKSPLELIRVYLTFPLADKALQVSPDSAGLMLAMGCCLYLLTGMILGVPLYWLMVRWSGESAPVGRRLLVATVLSVALWGIGFYGVLSWLQPLLFGGNWITDPAILPPWVAIVTHLFFGWVIALLHPWAQFTPYRTPSESPSLPTHS